MNKFACIFSILLMLPFGAIGQENNDLGSIELNVIDRYKGRIAEAVKISRNANFIDTNVRKLPVRYEVPVVTRQFTFRPKALKPMTISKVTVPVLPHYHLDLGAGLNGLFTAHASAGSDRSTKRQWGVELDHYNIRNGVSDIPWSTSQHFKNRLHGHLKLFLDQRKWSLNNQLLFGTEGIRYYGFPSENLLPNALPYDEALRQTYYDLGWNGTLTKLRHRQEKNALEQLQGAYHFFFDRFYNQEHQLNIAQQSHFDLSGQPLQLGSRIDYLRANFDSVQGGNRMMYNIGLMPSITQQWNGFQFKIGAQIGLYGRSHSQEKEATNNFYLLPDFEVLYSFVPTYFSVYGLWKGDVALQSYRNLAGGNPFIMPNGVAQEVSTRNYLEAGLKGRIINPLRFQLSARYTLADDMPFYYRNPFFFQSPYTPGLQVVYDDVDQITLRGELEFQQERWSAGGWLEYNLYETDSLAAAFHLPQWRMALNGEYKINNRLGTGIGLQYVGERTAYNPLLETLTQNTSTLDAYTDLHLHLRYHYNQYLQARLDFDNLLGKSYEIWYGYPSVGFQMALTLSYRF